MSESGLKLSSLLNLQAQLDETAKSLSEAQLDEYSMLIAKKTALIVEFFEFFNETKLFKFWAKKPINEEALKEEFIDILHFTLSLCLCYKKESLAEEYTLGISEPAKHSNKFIAAQSNVRLRTELLNISFDWMRGIYKAIELDNFEEWLGWLKSVSIWLSMTGEEIYKRYLSKWETNFIRLGVNPLR